MIPAAPSYPRSWPSGTHESAMDSLNQASGQASN